MLAQWLDCTEHMLETYVINKWLEWGLQVLWTHVT